MKMNVEEYLENVFRFSLLPKQERVDLAEEIRSHLLDKTEHLTQSGIPKELAIIAALKDCGKPEHLRRQITREIYGVASFWILVLTGFCTALFALFAITLPSFPLYSPSLMLCFAIGVTFLTKTRKPRDRASIAISLFPFLIAYFLSHFGHNLWPIRNLVLPGLPDSLWDGLGYLVLVTLGVGLYSWTRNIWSLTFPFLFSSAISLWPIVRQLATYMLSLFFAHPTLLLTPSPFAYPNSILLLSVLSRSAFLALLVLTVRTVRVETKEKDGVHLLH
ncbi:MAG: permease prefix domain 1-containing protein [Firmicutes bacterium]|nr:permease prefix domain 1-containing protein [Bacillota bacterium]